MDAGLIGSTGVERIIRLLDEYHLADIEGDVLEIGAFTGALTARLADWAAAHGKTVFAVDPFTPSLDTTKNDRGEVMADYYATHLDGRDQLATFMQNIEGKPNVRVLPFPSDAIDHILEGWHAQFCMVVVDGGHDPRTVAQDMDLAWEYLNRCGLMLCHDYGHDLPEVTIIIDKFILGQRHHATAFTLPEIAAIGVLKNG